MILVKMDPWQFNILDSDAPFVVEFRGTEYELETLVKVIRELGRAMRRFGKFNSAHEGYAVILEELDELWDEIKANAGERQVDEGVQVAAMALRFLLDIGPQTEEDREESHRG